MKIRLSLNLIMICICIFVNFSFINASGFESPAAESSNTSSSTSEDKAQLVNLPEAMNNGPTNYESAPAAKNATDASTDNITYADTAILSGI
jgi:hypothetical protein